LEADETKTFRDFIQPFLKQKWLILACVLVGVGPTAFVLMTTKPTYKATSTLLMEQEKRRVLDVPEVQPTHLLAPDYLPTQVLILERPSLALEVIEKLHLDQHQDFIEKKGEGSFPLNIREALAKVIARVIPENKQEQEKFPRADTVGDPLFPTIKAYMARLSIKTMKNSRLVTVSFSSHDPVLAARVANAHVAAYMGRNQSMQLDATKSATQWLESQLAEAQEHLRTSEETLQKFQEQEDILSLAILSSKGGGEEGNILLGKLAELNSSLTQAHTERIALETLLHQLQELSKTPGLMESIPEVSGNDLIKSLKVQYAELNQEYLELKKKYGQRHPSMVAVNDELRSLENRIAGEVKKIAKGVEVQYKVAKSREDSLRAALENVKASAVDLNKKAVQFLMLKQEVESNRQIYEMLIKRVKETSLTSGLDSSFVSIVESATIPHVPSVPKKKLILLIAALGGLTMGISLTFFLEHLDNTFHGADEVKKYLRSPFLGPVGLASIDKKGNGGSELLALLEPKSHFVECLRNICTNLIFSLTEPEQKTLVITSPNPYEGKTLITANLVVLLAHMGKKVLLIDADMRMPRMHHVYQIPLEPGLSNLVLSKSSITKALQRTGVSKLRVISAGTIPPDPTAILSSSKMAQRLIQFKKNFDVIIFDAPPILSATDASLLGGLVDGVILVVQAASTRRDMARRASEQLNHVRANIIGTILNKVNFKREHYYYSYYSLYNYYYTPEGRKKRRRRARQYQNQG
jgi:succinoglycan biosynthesis transport protein ExoP